MSTCRAGTSRIAKAAGIKKHLSVFMLRTFQDLCRAAQVHDFVARSISRHATVEMQQLYIGVSSLDRRAPSSGHEAVDRRRKW
jgi:hypothetical protein